MTGTRTKVITDSKEFESLAGIWDALLQNSDDDNSMFLAYEWLSTWWKHFGEGRKLNILLIEKQGQVIGIVPLMKTEYRIGIVRYHLLEVIGSVDCNYVGLIPAGNREEAVTALLAYLDEELRKGKLVLRLTLVPEDSKLLHLLRKHASLFSRSLVIREAVVTLAPYISLPATWDEYYHSLSRHLRKTLRRALRSLQEEHSVKIEECTADNLEERLSRFFDLHQRRWRSMNSSRWFSNPKMRDFYRDTANQFLKRKWLHFSWLTVDDEVAEAQYSFVYNRKLYNLIIARDLRYSKNRVGHLHCMFLIREAIKNGLREIDFMGGGEPYKFYWTKSARRYIQIIVINRGLCPGLRLKLLGTFLRVHEIKQNGLRESYRLRLMRKKEEKEKKRMGLVVKLG
jgi:CelD/BcsL family acetyltransferase involved in cellulose biosynthesis